MYLTTVLDVWMTLYLKKSESWRKKHLDDCDACSAILRNIIILMADEHVYELPPSVGRPAWKKFKLPAERVLHIDHLFARMQRLNTYEAKTNAMTRIGSNLSQVLPPPFSCE